MIRKKIGATLFFMLFLLTSSAWGATGTYKIGVLAKRGGINALSEWGQHAAYLSETLGERFAVVPIRFASVPTYLKDKKVDFILVNPAIFVEMQEKYNLKAIATMINQRAGKELHEFGGVIFTRKDSPLSSLQDVKGKKFGFVKQSSFGGLHTAQYLFQQNGIDLKRDCAAYAALGTHDAVVKAVADGSIDVGTVRTDTLEQMAAEGKINLTDFKIIHQVDDNFPFIHSTRLYPEWPMAMLPHVDKVLGQKVATALFKLNSQSPATQKAQIAGWQMPMDYTPIVECLRAIKYGVFAR